MDLEVQPVRCIDNFSTGARGAASVEAFLRKGYAVVHLWRTGSASPYGRLVAEAIGLGGNQGISSAAVGKLFVGAGDVEADDEDKMVQSVLNQDPWLTETTTGSSASASTSNGIPKKYKTSPNEVLGLHYRVETSTRLRLALKERQVVLEEGRLLTIPFRTVEEYLAKLQLCSLALQDSQALAIVYLAAAVSDFYVPQSQKSEHKIQSDGGKGLTLHLEPVPKAIAILRSEWAPDAFVCSFKLETDSTILRQKAERAVTNYGCHMVVGNQLQNRYSEVKILAPPLDGDAISQPHQWPMQTLQKSGEPDSLENQLVDTVIQAHFDYISKSCNGTFDKAGMEAVMKARAQVEEKKKQLEREIFWEKVQKTSLEWAGVAAGALLSYVVSSALRKRMGA